LRFFEIHQSSHILLQTLIDVEKRHPGLGIGTLTAALFAFVLAIMAAV